MSSSSPHRVTLGWLGLAAALWCLYLLGALFPRGGTWGFHFLAYLPRPLPLLLPGFTACLIVAGRSLPLEMWCRAGHGWVERGGRGALILAGLAVLLAVGLFAWRDRVLVYGDSQNIVKWFGDNRTLRLDWVRPLFSLDLSASRETLAVALHRLLAHLTGLSIADSYAIVSALGGAISLLLWQATGRADAGLRPWWLPLLLIGLFMSGNAIYLGHVENYALATTMAMLFLYLAERAHRTGSGGPAALLVFLLTARLHIAYVTLFPVALVVALDRRAGRPGPAGPRRTPRWLGVIALVLPLILGAFLYLFVFRAASWRTDIDYPLFLPLVPMKPPLRPYTLLSPVHLVDYLNALVHVLVPAGPVLAAGLWLGRRRKPWEDPLWFGLAAGLGLLLLFFFVANAAFSMPRDWDLFALAMPPTLYLTAATLRFLPAPRVHRGGVLLLALVAAPFTLSGHAVNWTPDLLVRRWADVSAHVYSTYYRGASYMLNDAARIGAGRPEMPGVVQAAAGRMRPWTGIADPEYARVMFVLYQVETSRGQTEEALRYMEKSVAANPGDESTLQRAVAAWAAAGRLEQARAAMRSLLVVNPGSRDNWRVHIQLQCQADSREACQQAVAEALRRFPDDAEFLSLRQ